MITRTYTLTDCGGLATELVQTITVADTEGPMFDGGLTLDITAECER